MSTKTTTPDLRELPLKTLVIDLALSGRSQKEITANAKALLPMLEASKGWDPTQPGAVFYRDDKPHLVRGFTRVTAALEAGIKVGHFYVVQDDPAKLRTEAIRSNAGKPISPFQQGVIFAAMRDGSKIEDVAVGGIALEPMTPQEIAEEIGVSKAWVLRCLSLVGAPESIQELILADAVNAKVVDEARKLAKDDEGKWLRIVKAAIKAAELDGKATATEQHFKAIKADFMPKLVADTNGAKPKGKEKADEPEEDGEQSGEHDNAPDGTAAGESGGSPAATPAMRQSAMDLGTPAPKKQTKADAKAMRDNLIAVILKCDVDEIHITFEQADVETLADAIIAAGFTAHAVPI